MKTSFVIVACFLLPQRYFAQSGEASSSGLGLSFNWTHIGSNTALSYVYQYERSTFAGGIKYQNNNPIDDYRGYAFYKKAYARNTSEAIGFHFEYTVDLGKPKQVIPYAMAMVQISNMRVRRTTMIDQHSVQTIVTNRYLFFENYFGAGLKIRMSPRWYLNQSAAFGALMTKAFEPPPEGMIYHTGPSWEFAAALRIGIIHRFAS